MSGYVTKEHNEYEVYACFSIENEKLTKICDKVTELYPDIYLNCYNWDALLYHYMQNNSPDLLVDLDSDIQEYDFIAIYQVNDINHTKIDKFINILTDFVENEDKLFKYIKDFESEIEWD